jgi:V8-like Glu-specific endopeptidase
MVVDFLSTNDGTGGNSGSPIMNGKGEIIGLIFDGDYESMTSDFQYDPDLTRAINVDVRYILLITEKMGQANRILKELDIR